MISKSSDKTEEKINIKTNDIIFKSNKNLNLSSENKSTYIIK